MGNIIDNLTAKYKTGSVLTRLILINIVAFILLKILGVIFTLFKIDLFNPILLLGVPSDILLLIKRIWTPVTYMFVHANVIHILFNMLWLYWFGKIFLQYFSGRTLGSLYLIGGVAGAVLYIVAFNTIPYYVDIVNSRMIGASAAVMAIVMGTAFYKPDLRLNLLLIGQIKIIYIAIFVFLLDFLSLSSSTNPGGHVAHIGGALLGYFFAVQYSNGKDITNWMSKTIDWFFGLFKPRRKGSGMRVNYTKRRGDWEYNAAKNDEQQEIDLILDKLKKTGYNGLTPEEKKKLFDASKR